MEEQVTLIFDDFTQRRRQFEAMQADKDDLKELSLLEQEIKRKQ